MHFRILICVSVNHWRLSIWRKPYFSWRWKVANYSDLGGNERSEFLTKSWYSCNDCDWCDQSWTQDRISSNAFLRAKSWENWWSLVVVHIALLQRHTRSRKLRTRTRRTCVEEAIQSRYIPWASCNPVKNAHLGKKTNILLHVRGIRIKEGIFYYVVM